MPEMDGLWMRGQKTSHLSFVEESTLLGKCFDEPARIYCMSLFCRRVQYRYLC